MAVVADPNFGAGFSASDFRTNIRNTMLMGLPEDRALWPTFLWSVKRTYASQDPAGKPYNFSARPVTEVTHDPVRVPVAVEFASNTTLSENLPAGIVETTKVIVTILDEDYAEVKSADTIQMDQSDYRISFVAPVVGLFDVTVYQLYCQTGDES